LTWVGRPLARAEDVRFLTGSARYLPDLEAQGAVEVAFVRSPHAYARIAGIDAGACEGAAVLTAADLAGVRPLPAGSIEDGVVADAGHPILAGDSVRYVGEPVALVAAESRAAAEDAAELVEVDYEPLPPLLDPRAAGEEDVLARWSKASGASGDVEAAFAAADRVVSCSVSIPRLVAAPLEGRGALAHYEPDEDLLVVHCSAQDPHRPLAHLAHALERDPARIRVVVPDVGGAFGSKGAIGPEIVAVAAAAVRLGRPVRWVEDRLENFLAAYQGRGLEADAELAVAADGRFLALRARLHADLGAYLYPTTAVPGHTTAMLLTGAYTIHAAEVTLVGARTNKPPTGPYRGAGRPEAALVIERLVEQAARELDMDPFELRRRNFVPRDAFPYATPLGWTYDSGDYGRCLDRALELFGIDERRAEVERARAEGRLAGIGTGMVIERCGGLWESASVEVADGHVVVRTGSSPHGQGHETTFAQIAADELGVAPEDVTVVWGDTQEVPPGIGTFASRSVAMGGSAVVKACRKLRESGSTRAEARFESPLLFSSGAYAAAVEIERGTGRLHVLGLAAVDDPGTVVNPLLAEGQVRGAVAQGLGECLVEEAVYDEEGQPRTVSFVDYKLLTAAEIPPLETKFVETPSPHTPLGTKGVGEAGAIGTPAAVANAVADALAAEGLPALDPPFTEERLWAALRETSQR
jgi:aerobic carbon-monoxide dehydrogenase large subunit